MNENGQTQCEVTEDPNCSCHGCAEKKRKRPFLDFLGRELSPSRNAQIIFRDS
jgi:hypothetical protein